MHSDSLAVHAGREDFDELGVHAPPLDLSTTYPLPALDAATVDLDALIAGEPSAGSSVYARLHNPTVARFERALAALEGTHSAVAFGSGMAAMTACLLAARQRGRHIVATRPLYGTSEHLLESGLVDLEVTWSEPAGLSAALRPDTALVIVETPANPTLEIVDIAATAAAAGDVPVLVDSTFATPVLQQPAAEGATLVLHSATKFLGGHGDVIAGVVATDAEWSAALRRVRIATGALLHPLAAYLLHRGLATLPLRVRHAEATATELASRLAAHPAVRAVHHPSRCASSVWRRQMRGPGPVLAFEVDNAAMAARLMAALELITPAVSLGSTDTLIQHPAGLTHRVVTADSRRRSGIGEGLLRLSLGLEHVEDLWADLSGALARSTRRLPRRAAG